MAGQRAHRIRLGQQGGEETKNPPCQSARRVSENLLRNSKSSLAVFYVEQVALNRHVSVRLQSSRLAATAAILFIAEGLREVKGEFRAGIWFAVQTRLRLSGR